MGWLREIDYVGRGDDQLLDEFLGRLGRRGAHLRPGIEVQRIWRRADATDLDKRGALTGEVRAALGELLTALDEPLPPAVRGARIGVPGRDLHIPQVEMPRGPLRQPRGSRSGASSIIC
ncbi:MAG TPA: hypothetical protein VF940_22240 [Streptosporangiaceae bacterium]